MRRRTLGNAAVLTASLLALTGLGVTIAYAATDGEDPAAVAGECADVFLTIDPAGDPVGKLCTAADADGTTLSGVALTFTASSNCSGTVMLRVSGLDASGAEFGEVEKANCGSGTATASFTPASRTAPDTYLCGTLLADRYTAAQACVALS
ncbi:hypothetical protein [Actinoplanes regularis]|uniref:Uncharacterized protein n=1 Tax=Actinoplanes regularis TaxID=52697 RepID=A0A238Z6X5_9ACTN|nr:hypothetical protein [Actinoplanes regularis]GIE85847.1 hypothetical protein Are01nite_23270 [Actinoplanes regularis]SNR78661.1 hypothetical protein SAMN06264365_105459 [Actinoplanes regularis]